MSVYFIRNKATRNIKIGFTASPFAAERLEQLQTATDCELALELVIPWANRHDERTLHAIFSADRIRGEWFATTKEIEALIAFLTGHTARLFRPILWRDVVRAASKAREAATQ